MFTQNSRWTQTHTLDYSQSLYRSSIPLQLREVVIAKVIAEVSTNMNGRLVLRVSYWVFRFCKI